MFTGIRFAELSTDFRRVRMTMALRFYNKNLHGLQFGGNLYAMIDPCYLTLILYNLGKGYRVLDKAAQIEYVKPGRTKVSADILLTQEDIDDIKKNTSEGQKYLKDFNIEIQDINGEIIARVKKTIYIRKKFQNSS